MTERARVGVLVSGEGSNMEALIRAGREPDSAYDVVLVLTNNPDAPALARAATLGVPAKAIDHRPFGPERDLHERALDAELRAAGVEWVALAGYMRVLTPWLVNAWSGRMLNVHPSLLPAYPGLHTHARVLAAGETVHGCTVHGVTEGVDAGPPLGQVRVTVRPDDTEGALAARVQAAEHRLYPAVLSAVIKASRLAS
jgi:formyltetrahydrofolate-dependent phosphoribosylglycinamide formyltransferase